MHEHLMITHCKCNTYSQQGAGEVDEDDVEAAAKDADRAQLKLFHALLKGDKIARALEVAAQLRLPASLQGALKLANHHR